MLIADALSCAVAEDQHTGTDYLSDNRVVFETVTQLKIAKAAYRSY